MEHIKQFDWCSSEPDVHFLLEKDVDNCVTEKIIRNKFHDPLISSESEDESKPKLVLNWDKIFSRNDNDKVFRRVIQGIHPVPHFIKLSALTAPQHYQCLKVLCSQNPEVMPGDFFPRPTKQDYRVFEELKEVYTKEQKEFTDWAKTLWTSNHCVRALRPKPPVESVYEAEFKVRAGCLQSFPKTYSMAGQIALESPDDICELVHQKDIIKVNMSSLPQLQYPDMNKRVTILKPCPVPEPCTKHPCRFVLPNETAMTLLPLTEIHKELAQFALDNGATNIASESALRCLMWKNRHWMLPVSVCAAMTPDGDTRNVVVLGSEFSNQRETAHIRTYKAFRRLLEQTLIPPMELIQANKKKESGQSEHSTSNQNMDVSDDEDDNLYIDMDMMNDQEAGETSGSSLKKKEASKSSKNTTEQATKIDFYNCSCVGTAWERPPPRSFRRWRVRRAAAPETLHLVVHAPHKARGHSGEVILEPIPEYQIDLGASEQSQDVVRSMALAMMLRKNASVLNVRVDSTIGDIVTTHSVYSEDLNTKHPQTCGDVAGRIMAALSQLRGLRPGQYVLLHEPSHGNNALLYGAPSAGDRLTLQFDCSQLADDDEAKSLRAPPQLIPVLLPVHKYRRLLPCAFTPHRNQLAREPKKPAARQKTPPRAITWPKRRGRKKKKNNDNNQQ